MPPRKEKSGVVTCQWTQEDEATLVHVFKEHKAMGNWGDNNPKTTTWTACELTLLGSEKKSGGAPKTVNAIRNRWQHLKKEYAIVKQLRTMSGWSWNPKNNLPNVENEVWEAYIEKHLNAKPFRTKEFPLFNDVAELINGTQATGANAYREGETTPVIAPYAPSSDKDEFGATQMSFASKYGAKLTQSYFPGSSANTEPTQQSSNKGKQRDAGDANKETQIDSGNENIDPDLLLDPDVRPENVVHQRSKSSGSAGNDRRKKRRRSSDKGMQGIGKSMEDVLREVKETMIESRTQVPVRSRVDSSSSTQAAKPEKNEMETIVSAIEDNGDLSDNEKLHVFKILKVDPNVCKIYAAMNVHSLKTSFLRDKINEYRERKYGITKE